MDTSRYIEQLSRLGLTTKEASIYLAILELGSGNVQQIAQASHLERTTSYYLLTRLQEKGLVSQAEHGKRVEYVAEPVTALKQFIDQQSGIVSALLPTLAALASSNSIKPTIKLYESLVGIKQAFLATLEGKEKLRRDFSPVTGIVEFLGKRCVEQQIERRVARKIKVRSLRSQASEQLPDWYLKSTNKDVLREVRHLSQNIDFTPTIFIHDNTVTIISSTKEAYALVINSQEFSQALKVLFDIAWAQATPAKRK